MPGRYIAGSRHPRDSSYSSCIMLYSAQFHFSNIDSSGNQAIGRRFTRSANSTAEHTHTYYVIMYTIRTRTDSASSYLAERLSRHKRKKVTNYVVILLRVRQSQLLPLKLYDCLSRVKKYGVGL